MKLKIKKMPNIILASKSKVRKEILEKNFIDCKVIASNLDEEPIKESLIKNGASPELISKNLAFKCINAFLSTKFEGGRHLKRVKKI